MGVPVILIGALDTKGTELGFVRDLLAEKGVSVMVVDAGVLGPPALAPDIPREQVFEAAGTTLAQVLEERDRGRAVMAAAAGVRTIVLDLFAQGQVAGVLGIGGSAGTAIATSAMRALPFGVPKLMVTTMASGQVRQYVGPRDLLMMHSVTDICGLNRVSRVVLSNAAHAMAGMVQSPPPPPSERDRPLITATMFGVTTPCVEACRRWIEPAGFETLVFHAEGSGGEAMESLIRDGLIAGVLDVTTTELADELVGGVLSAGPQRLTAAAQHGVPQVVSVGALDMVNFGPRHTVPPTFEGRHFYQHNESVTLMRTTPGENASLGREIATKLSAAKGPVAVFLPLRGVSALDAQGKAFWHPEADAALFQSIRDHLAGSVELIELDLHLNDPEFAAAMARKLLAFLGVKAHDVGEAGSA